MNEDKKCVLIVDDSAFDIEILKRHLEQDYVILTATNGQDALTLASQSPKPDLILLDAVMPDMDGYETCRRLKDDFETDTIDVIFVSAHDDIEDKLVGYQAGGCDYLIKPVVPQELQQKVRLAIQNQEQRVRIEQEKAEAIQAAMTAITGAGEQGAMLDFLRDAFSCKSPESLADELFKALGQYGLQGLLEMRDGEDIVRRSSQGECTSLECSILEYVRSTKHMYQLKDRFVVNYPHFTLIVTSLPMEDPDFVGRLRDYLAILSECVEGRFVAFKVDERRMEQLKGIIDAVASLTATLEAIDNSQRQLQFRIQSIARDHQDGLERAFIHLGLTENQEEFLIGLARNAAQEIDKAHESNIDISNHLREVIGQLQHLVGKQDI
jgi:CheY-like chemotaxis protein